MNYLSNEEGVSLKGASSFMLRNIVINILNLKIRI